MSYRLQDLIWQKSFPGLGSADRFVLLSLAFRANEAGVCWPSLEGISRVTNLNLKTVRSSLKTLAEKRLIDKTDRKGAPALFKINLDVIGALPSVALKPVACTKNGSTEIGTPPENGTPAEIGTPTENGTRPLPKMAGEGVPKTVPEQVIQQTKEQVIVSCALPAGSSAADLCPSVDEFGLTNEPAFVAEKPKKQTKKPKAVTHAFNLETLPEDWAVYCKEVRPDLDPARVFSAFKAYWTMGRGKGTLRADKSWFQSWANWVKKENEGRGRGQADEGTGMLPDQSRNPFYFPDGGRPNRKTTEVPHDYDATAAVDDLVEGILR